MKIFKKAFALGLCTIACFSAVACNPDGSEGDEATIEFIRNGYSRYSILLADDASGNEEYAANELQSTTD